MNKLVKEYQCPGCACGPTDKYACYKKSPDTATCEAHGSGTSFFNESTGMIKVLLGLPTGFNRTGHNPHPLYIFDKWADCTWFEDGHIYNLAIWFHVNGAGHTLIRAYQPRKNLGFTLVIDEDVSREMLTLDCIEITEEMMKEMD